jgi:CPA2 family monovalent cation:H+ antiporter-2
MAIESELKLIPTIAYGLGFATIGGMIAHRLHLPPLVGFLLAGIAVGPYTPGFVAEVELADQLAQLGIILMMFGVGMHFSVGELLAVRGIAIPGAILQISVATLLGMAAGWLWGWPLGHGLVFGLSLSVASTVVLLRALEARDLLKTENGRIAVGWLIVEDLVVIVVLVLFPSLAYALGTSTPEAEAATPSEVVWKLARTLLQLAVFIGFMLLLGRRLLHALLTFASQTGSRELFTLTSVSVAIGLAYLAYQVFDVKYPLAAFFAGIVLHESDQSHRAAEELKPLEDVFAALFFVSVGMLFDPGILLRQPLAIAVVVAIILVGKTLAAALLVRLLGRPWHTALLISVALAQIGEFSFLLGSLGLAYGLLSKEGQNLIVAGALISIMLNPLLFGALQTWVRPPEAGDTPDPMPDQASASVGK